MTTQAGPIHYDSIYISCLDKVCVFTDTAPACIYYYSLFELQSLIRDTIFISDFRLPVYEEAIKQFPHEERKINETTNTV